MASPRRDSAYANVDSLRIWARQRPSRAAVIEADGVTLTYSELDHEVDRVAHVWDGLGVQPGDRIALWLENSAMYLTVYLGCLRAGVVVVQVNHRHTAVEARHQIEAAEAEVLVFDDSVAERVAALGVPLRAAISVGAIAPVAGTLELPVLLAAASATPTFRTRSHSDLAVLGFTSGTTGYPKAAELTHGSIRAIGDTNMVACRYALGSVQIFGFSLSFTAGIPAHVLPHLRVGGTTVLLRTWDTERIVDEIARHRATFTLLPSPPIPEFCEVVEQDPSRVASLQALLHSTARAPEAHLERLVDAIGPRLIEGWGMTENSGGLATATTSMDYSSGREGILSSAGCVVPGADVRAVDVEGAELPPGSTEVGLLEIRTDSLARGYWRDPQATAESFHDGWFSTGDLGTIDTDGYVYLVDRRSDLIISGGMNVYPSEVERVLSESPDVAVCAVVGAPHERWGRTPVAFIIATDPDRIDASPVLEFARQRLASYKLPTEVRFVRELPTNSGGKILRRELIARLEVHE